MTPRDTANASACPRCGSVELDCGCTDPPADVRAASSGVYIAPDLFRPCGVCGHDPRWIVLDPQVWAQIVFRVRAGDDAGLVALVDQAVMGPKP